MTANLDRLMQSLAAEAGLLEEMSVLLNEERRSVVNLDAAALEVETERKKELQARLESSSSLCRQQLHRLGEELRLPGVKTISEVLPRLSGAEHVALKQAQQRLLRLGGEVDRQQSLNRNLLENSLNLVNESLQFFNSLLTRRPTYGQHGMMMDSGSGIRLVNKEI